MNLARIFRNSVYMGFGIVIGKISNLLWRSWMSKNMSENDFSVFIFCFSILQIFLTVLTSSVNELITQRLASINPFNATEEYSNYLRLFLFVNIFSSTVVFVACFWGATYISEVYRKPELAGFIKLIAFVLPIMNLTYFLTSVLRARDKFVPRILFQQIGVSPFLFLFAVGFTYVSMLTVRNAILIYMVSSGIILVACLLFTYNDIFIQGVKIFCRIRIPLKEIRLMFFFFASLIGIQLLGLTGTWGDSLILGYFLFNEIGSYSNILFIAKSMLVMQGALYVVCMPMLARQIALKQIVSVKKTYDFIIVLNMVFIIPFSLVSIYYAPHIVEVLYEYRSSETIIAFRILIMFYTLSGLFGPVTLIVVASRKSKHMLFSSIMFLVINISLSFVLIPLQGIKGAAVAAGLAFMLSNGYLAFLNYKMYNARPSLKVILFIIISFLGFYPVSLWISSIMIKDINILVVGVFASLLVTSFVYVVIFGLNKTIHDFKNIVN